MSQTDPVLEARGLAKRYRRGVWALLLPREVFYGVAASRYPGVLVRESAALGAATVLFGALAAIVIRRRRPE